jgi:hypothetical protein
LTSIPTRSNTSPMKSFRFNIRTLIHVVAIVYDPFKWELVPVSLITLIMKASRDCNLPLNTVLKTFRIWTSRRKTKAKQLDKHYWKTNRKVYKLRQLTARVKTHAVAEIS